MNKILINFNQVDYDNALNKFKQKEDAFLRIGIIPDSLGFYIRPDETDFKEAILKAIAEKYKKENTLNLSAEKLVQLMEINLDEFYKAVNLYESLKNIQEPDREKYSIYITTEKQIERWELANELKAIFEKSKTVAPFIKPRQMIGHLHPIFTLNLGILNININYILNG